MKALRESLRAARRRLDEDPRALEATCALLTVAVVLALLFGSAFGGATAVIYGAF